MSPPAYKRFAILLGLICVVLLAVGVYILVEFTFQTVCIAFADEQVRIFDAMRNRALEATPVEAAGCLNQVVNYYPSGTKQDSGSKLDRVVEQARASAIREIIEALRHKTGEDLGDDAKPWIEKYVPKR